MQLLQVLDVVAHEHLLALVVRVAVAVHPDHLHVHDLFTDLPAEVLQPRARLGGRGFWSRRAEAGLDGGVDLVLAGVRLGEPVVVVDVLATCSTVAR